MSVMQPSPSLASQSDIKLALPVLDNQSILLRAHDNHSDSTPHAQILTDREQMEELCLRLYRHRPWKEQLDVAELVGSGQDCVLIAGCGWGKTLTFSLPLLHWKDRSVVIISPLKALADEQQKKLEKVGVPAIVLKKEIIPTKREITDIVNGTYRAIFMTPEVIFSSSRVDNLWQKQRWRDRLMSVVVDEAHCVHTWGGSFRKDYSRLGELRGKVRCGIGFISLSATLPPHYLATLKTTLFYGPDLRLINLGNDRPNVQLAVDTLRHPANSFRDLDFLLRDYKKTIVYFQSRNDAESAAEYLRLAGKEEHEHLIGVYHSLHDTDDKAVIMDGIVQDQLKLIMATEAAGMGCDLDNVERVVQYGLPPDISTLVQRQGRAARDTKARGLGLLLIPKDINYNKIDPDLAEYIRTDQCRRRVLNRVFDNMDRDVVDVCCDIHHELDLYRPVEEQEHDTIVNARVRASPRSVEEKALALQLILTWRTETFNRDRPPSNRFATHNWIMPLEIAKTLSDKFAHVKDLDSMQKTVRWEPSTPEYVEQVMQILVELNNDIDSKRVRRPKTQSYAQRNRVDRVKYGMRIDLTAPESEQQPPEQQPPEHQPMEQSHQQNQQQHRLSQQQQNKQKENHPPHNQKQQQQNQSRGNTQVIGDDHYNNNHQNKEKKQQQQQQEKQRQAFMDKTNTTRLKFVPWRLKTKPQK